MGSYISCSGSIVEPSASGTGQPLTSSHRGHLFRSLPSSPQPCHLCPIKKTTIEIKNIFKVFLSAFAVVNLYDYWLQSWKRNLHLEPAPFILLALPAYIQASFTDTSHVL